MTHRAFLIGCVLLYVAIFALLLPTRLSESPELTFSSDASHYHHAAISLVTKGMYSLDGDTPFIEREPGQSVFLALIYSFFGVGNRAAIFFVQAALYLLMVLLFVRELSRFTSSLSGLISFLLLLTIPAVWHAHFSVYRESIALSLFLGLTALFLSFQHVPSQQKAVGIGVLLAAIILTYIPFLFFPIFLAALCIFFRMEWKYIGTVVLIPFLIVFLWSSRNFLVAGTLRPVGSFRTTAMWYARAEQAEHVRGLEPLRCLFAEYITRDWSGRSDACSTNSLINTRWPAREPTGGESRIAAESQRKILRYFPSYLWFSLFEVLELHLPFVNGWGLPYNILASISTLLLYLGIALGGKALFRREFGFLFLLIAYSTVMFSLTDATPRYLLPVVFCYATLAAFGWSRIIGVPKHT